MSIARNVFVQGCAARSALYHACVAQCMLCGVRLLICCRYYQHQRLQQLPCCDEGDHVAAAARCCQQCHRQHPGPEHTALRCASGPKKRGVLAQHTQQ